MNNREKGTSLIRRKIILFITETLSGSGSAITTATILKLNPSDGIVLTISTALVTSIAISTTNENISHLKIRCAKIGDWINVITLLFENTIRPSMIDEKLCDKETSELKKVFYHYRHERSDIMKNTQFRVEYVFRDFLNKDSISPEQ